jgi:hypothetical protein
MSVSFTVLRHDLKCMALNVSFLLFGLIFAFKLKTANPCALERISGFASKGDALKRESDSVQKPRICWPIFCALQLIACYCFHHC